jgi:hypothetical protein
MRSRALLNNSTRLLPDAAEAGISADDLEQAAGDSLKEYLRTAIIDTSE